MCLGRDQTQKRTDDKKRRDSVGPYALSHWVFLSYLHMFRFLWATATMALRNRVVCWLHQRVALPVDSVSYRFVECRVVRICKAGRVLWDSLVSVQTCPSTLEGNPPGSASVRRWGERRERHSIVHLGLQFRRPRCLHCHDSAHHRAETDPRRKNRCGNGIAIERNMETLYNWATSVPDWRARRSCIHPPTRDRPDKSIREITRQPKSTSSRDTEVGPTVHRPKTTASRSANRNISPHSHPGSRRNSKSLPSRTAHVDFFVRSSEGHAALARGKENKFRNPLVYFPRSHRPSEQTSSTTEPAI
ncbi:hypothetical protein VTK73DRAFT_5019 [Phialemonium thermophilum]|uniref:Uncharacterized protein n=1 Tax=Phialemonium thermophilum TaxID=223376 RepID=A0ABR3V482_9PEZI